MKNVEMDFKQRSRGNRKKRFKDKLLGGIGLCRQAGQKRRARIDHEARSLAGSGLGAGLRGHGSPLAGVSGAAPRVAIGAAAPN